MNRIEAHVYYMGAGLSLLLFTGCPLSSTPSSKPSPRETKTVVKSPIVKSPVEKEKQVKPEAQKEGMDPITTPSGLMYIDEKLGTGASPGQGQRVSVHYTGRLENGQKFDSSRDRGQPFQFTLGVGQVIKGWDEGVKTMKVGGKRKLIIPPNLGYGERGVGGIIPPHSELHFDVELLEIK